MTMKSITMKIPESYINTIELLIEKGLFHNRCELIRTAIFHLLFDMREYHDFEPKQYFEIMKRRGSSWNDKRKEHLEMLIK